MFHLQEGPAYTEAFLTVLRQVSKEEVVQYILALLDDMITGGDPSADMSLYPNVEYQALTHY